MRWKAVLPAILGVVVACGATPGIEIRAAVRRWVNADRPGPKATGDMADIIDLMLATGCRIGEILALRWSDLDLDGAPDDCEEAAGLDPRDGRDGRGRG